ncbi:GNAT family N-acetyltransferase [Nonomuraea sp. KC401]|nr:GNAT family N-acetyltransferase [Nonomuraea sp. K271]TLF68375.1 GNAT family N-acetyltransferase [Nonomuraea sp. KC401]
MLPPDTAGDTAAMAALSDLVNTVYTEAERGIWRDAVMRTSPAELSRLTRDGQIAVAGLYGRTVGCVRVQHLDAEASEFAMLAATPESRGIGVGRALVRFAEQHARARGSRIMQLELLTPRTWSHPVKSFLAGWYGRLGYRMVRVGTIEEFYPRVTGKLAVPCDFRVYHKDLLAGALAGSQGGSRSERGQT